MKTIMNDTIKNQLLDTMQSNAIGMDFYELVTTINESRVQYDCRDAGGELFSCIARDLEEARAKRDAWLHCKNA